MKILKHKWFLATYLVIVVFIYLTSNSWKIHKEYPYQFTYGSDVNQYYSYLPALFIHGDLSMNYPNERGYWLVGDSNQPKLQKMTCGMAIMYSPFFLVGHSIAKLSDAKADGYTKPYSISLRIGTYIYVSIGLYLLYLSLLCFFKPWISTISILLIFISTNLFYYSFSEAEMSHSYLFFLFSVVIYYTLKWTRNHQKQFLYYVALALGMAVLIRPTSIVVVLFPLLYVWSNKESIKALFQNKLSLIISIVLFFIPIFIQMLYWKVYGGTWMRWSYGDEHFYFSNPHVIDFLFSYRKGWFVYTPIMIFSIVGLLFLPKKIKGMKWSIPIILVLAIFILSSWWCWWFGGSYGSRSMVEFYALLIFPLAAFIEKISQIKYINYAFVLVFGFTTFYNVLGHHKKTWWQLHWDSMNKESFWYTFSRMDMTMEEKKEFESLLSAPDYENARKGMEEREEF